MLNGDSVVADILTGVLSRLIASEIILKTAYLGMACTYLG
jgi:hypothetical protein